MTYFYGRLFAAHPEVRTMFPPAMAAQRRRLYHTLCRIAAGTHDPGPRLDAYLAELGRVHRKFGVRQEHYEAFAEALDATFRRHPPDGARWTGLERTGSLRHAAEVMSGAAADESAPAWWTAEVLRHERPAPGIAVLTARPSAPLPYLPGQHVPVLTPRWPRVWRMYSMANAPSIANAPAPARDESSGDGTITFHVRAVPGGLVSTALLRTVPGDTLTLGAAEGAMTADTMSPRDALCLAGGTGLAPLKAITEALLAGTRQVTLCFGARSEAGLYDLPALRAMERDHPALEVRTATSDEDSRAAAHGTVPDLVTSVEWHDRDIYISGPDAMIAETVDRLRELGVPPQRLRYDLPGEAPA
ncbi:MAG TPA: globin domain-containing protein [Trebonia sp.]